MTGTNDQTDGSAIDWTAASNFLTPGRSLGGFAFVSPDGPAALAGLSPTHPFSNVMVSEVYSGAAFSDAGFQLTVAPVAASLAASTTSVVSSQPTIIHGQPVTFTATVAPTSGSGADPTGLVNFLENGTSIGTAPLVSGVATLSNPSLPIGSLSITAEYGGDAAYSSSTSAAITQTVNAPAATATTLTSSASSIASGDSVTFNAMVSPVTPGGTAPTGTVTFTQNGNTLGTVALQANGAAQLATSTLPIGTDAITAAYSGDANFAASTSAVTTETVTTGSLPSTTGLTALPAAIHAGDTVTFTAAVAALTPQSAIPTGTVTFTQDGNALGTQPLQNGGTAVLGTASLPLGADHITATYCGDAHFAPSTSTTVIETVSTPPTLVPTIARSTLPVTLVAGFAAHGAVTLDIANTTGVAIKGKVTVELFASTSGSIDASAIQLAHVVRAVNVKATRPSVMALGVKIAPATVPAGAYTLLVRVVDLAGNNNDSSTGQTLSVAAPTILLSETVVKSTFPASAPGGSKAHATVVLRITNSGNITTPSKTSASLFASLSGVVDANAVQLISVTKPLRIRPNRTNPLALSLKKIPAIAPGTYTIIAQVTDPNGQISSVAVGTISIS